MKFLVIGKPIVSDHAIETSSRSVSSQASAVASLVGGSRSGDGGGGLEKAYALISGGFVLIINANDTLELATTVRANPLFKTCHVEIIPIADAQDFLEAAASYAG